MKPEPVVDMTAPLKPTAAYPAGMAVDKAGYTAGCNSGYT
jgi:hypothetical protein